MIYRWLRDPLLRLLKVTPGPPEPPSGTHASVRVFRASPAFLRYRLLGVGIGATVALVVFVAVGVGATLARETGAVVITIVAGVVVLAVLGVVYAGVRIDYEVRHYVFTDRSMRVREGAWMVREMTLSFANVQNLRVTQGPLQRLFGISDLRVDTAGGGATTATEAGGGGSHALTVAGVENAADLRDLVSARVRRHGDAGLGDPDDRRGQAPAARRAAPSAEAMREALLQVRDAARELRDVAAASGG